MTQLDLFDQSDSAPEGVWCRIRRVVRERERLCRNRDCRKPVNPKAVGVVRDVVQVTNERGTNPVSEMFAYCNNDCRNEAFNAREPYVRGIPTRIWGE